MLLTSFILLQRNFHNNGVQSFEILICDQENKTILTEYESSLTDDDKNMSVLSTLEHGDYR